MTEHTVVYGNAVCVPNWCAVYGGVQSYNLAHTEGSLSCLSLCLSEPRILIRSILILRVLQGRVLSLGLTWHCYYRRTHKDKQASLNRRASLFVLPAGTTRRCLSASTRPRTTRPGR